MSEIEIQFRNELQELLNKYNAELEGEDIGIKAIIPSNWDGESEYVEIDLGQYLFPTKRS